LSAAIGGYQRSEHKKEKAQEEERERVLKDKLENKEFYFYGISEGYKKGQDFEKKEQTLKNAMTGFRNNFEEIYGQ